LDPGLIAAGLMIHVKTKSANNHNKAGWYAKKAKKIQIYHTIGPCNDRHVHNGMGG
jgi:hypothetical protein